MQFHFPELVYDCIQCGKSCRLFEVELNSQERPSFVALPLQVRDSGRVFLEKDEAGRCRQLDSDNLCSLHKSQGFDNKPQACKDFPFHATATPEGIFVGLSFCCSAVVRGAGRRVEAHREQLEQRFGCLEGVAPEGSWTVGGEFSVDWAGYRRIEAFLDERLVPPSDYHMLLAAAQLGAACAAGSLEVLEQSYRPQPALGNEADNLVKATIALVETVGCEGHEIESVLRALHSQGSYFSHCLKGPIELSSLGELNPGFHLRTTSFLRHLLFRKHLLGAPDILSRAALMPILVQVLAHFSVASAQLNQREVANDDDYEKALEIVEGRLLFHARGIEGFFARIGRGFLNCA